MLPPDYPFRLVFLDTNVVRYLATFPSHFFEGGVDEREADKLARIASPRLRTDIHVLQALPDFLERGVPHGIVVTSDVLAELPAQARQYGEDLRNWCREMDFVDDYVPRNFFDNVANVLDAADRRLYLQAFALGCDAFLTTDYKTIIRRRHRLPPRAPRVVTPSEWWQEMRPWAGLFL